MTELRWTLLLAGLVVLVGLFVWTRFKSHLQGSFRGLARPVPPSAPAVPEVRQEPHFAPPEPVPAEPVQPEPSSAQVGRIAQMPEMIVTIRVLSPPGNPFPAESLVLALRDAGLRHGRFGIFHCNVSDTDDTPVFSVASLTEPGTFDLTRLQTDVYQGVSLFLGLPGPVDAVMAFESMVNAARSIARQLEGNVVDEHGSTFSVQRERYLREEVIEFQHRQRRTA